MADAIEPVAPVPARRRRHPGVVIGVGIIVAVALIAGAADLLAPYPFGRTNLLDTWAPPSTEHLLGTDGLGRDILSRLIQGARTSLVIGVGVTALTLGFGVAYGAVAAWVGGRVDGAMMRLVDIVLAFPEVVLAILVASVLGPGIVTVIVALTLVWWPGVARLARSLVLVIRTEPYIDAARVAGRPALAILLGHVLPNMLAPILVRGSVGIGFIIMAEATLSFLGLGVQEPVPSWGGMIRDGLAVLRSDPHLAWSASALLALTIIGFNVLGDGLRDVLDPRHGERR